MYRYATTDYDTEHMARAVGKDLPISTKLSIEICNQLRGKDLQQAKQYLSDVIEMKQPVPMKKFHRELAHRRAIGPGRYPIKASQEILSMLQSVESNAQFKGLHTADLVIYHVCAQKSSASYHFGRQRRKMKRTTIEVIVKEQPKADAKKDKQPAKEKKTKEK